MASGSFGSNCPSFCHCLLLTNDWNVAVSRSVRINWRRISGHDEFPWSEVLGRVAFVPCCCYITFCVNLRLHFINCSIGSFRTQNDNKQVDSSTKLNSWSGFHHEQNRMPVYFFIHSLWSNVVLLYNAVLIFVLAILVLQSEWALLQQESS